MSSVDGGDARSELEVLDFEMQLVGAMTNEVRRKIEDLDIVRELLERKVEELIKVQIGIYKEKRQLLRRLQEREAKVEPPPITEEERVAKEQEERELMEFFGQL